MKYELRGLFTQQPYATFFYNLETQKKKKNDFPFYPVKTWYLLISEAPALCFCVFFFLFISHVYFRLSDDRFKLNKTTQREKEHSLIINNVSAKNDSKYL